ncbi:MAG TPA: PPOX class F420-dependent oxidoreductase [Nitrolancea sp.]|nr:PPOX class F420-dependent oxidoreductase [Nitrolancea sp.]
MLFTNEEAAYLAAQRIGRLATVQKNGTVQANPVGFSINEKLGTIDIGGRQLTASQKFRNVRAHPQIALVIDDIPSVDPWRTRGIEIRGTAEALANPTDSASFIPGAIIRIHPRRIISWGIDSDRMIGRNVDSPASDR